MSNIPKGDVRLTANIRKDLHKRLKDEAAQRETTIGELIEEMIENKSKSVVYVTNEVINKGYRPIDWLFLSAGIITTISVLYMVFYG